MSASIQESRVGDNSPQSTVLASTNAVLALPRPEWNKALVIWPGFERKHCFLYGTRLWKEHHASVLLVAGQNPEESPNNLYLDVEQFRKEFKLCDDSEIHSQGKAFNTRMQAEWLAEMARTLKLEDVALVAPAFHMTRAYMTIVASMKKAGVGHVSIFPFPTAMDPGENIPIPNACQWDFAEKEAKRILAYQAKGDVCSFEELHVHVTETWQKYNEE